MTDNESEFSDDPIVIRARYKDAAKGPGKFEGESDWAVYLWDRSLEGCQDDTQYDPEDDTPIEIFEVNDNDRAIFPELKNVVEVWLWEDSQGFVCTRTFDIGEDIPSWDEEAHEYAEQHIDCKHAELAQLDRFTRSYIEAALWSSYDDEDRPLDANYDIDDIAIETLNQMVLDCRDFQATFGELFDSAHHEAGRDFWFTRNGHGAGFWDGAWSFPARLNADCALATYTGKTEIPDVGAFLTEMSKAYGSFNLDVDEDGKIHS